MGKRKYLVLNRPDLEYPALDHDNKVKFEVQGYCIAEVKGYIVVCAKRHILEKLVAENMRNQATFVLVRMLTQKLYTYSDRFKIIDPLVCAQDVMNRLLDKSRVTEVTVAEMVADCMENGV